MVRDILQQRQKRMALMEAKSTPDRFYKVCPDCSTKTFIPNGLLESNQICSHCHKDITYEPVNERTKRVVKDGEVVKKKIKTKKEIMTAAEKQALRKARKKAHTSAAKKKRKKSLAKGERMGLYDSKTYIGEDGYTYAICPNCDAHNSLPDNINESRVRCGECNSYLFESTDSVNSVLQKVKQNWGSLSSGKIPAYILDELKTCYEALKSAGSKLLKIKPMKGLIENQWAEYDTTEINNLYRAMNQPKTGAEQDYATLMYKLYCAFTCKAEDNVLQTIGEEAFNYSFEESQKLKPKNLDAICDSIEEAQESNV